MAASDGTLAPCYLAKPFSLSDLVNRVRSSLALPAAPPAKQAHLPHAVPSIAA